MPDLLFEIGAEEIPAGFLPPAAESLRAGVTRALAAARLPHGEVRTFATPRRLALVVREVAARQADEVKEMVGPAWKAAFDAEGKPTKAAQGFARGAGMPESALYKVSTPKGDYVAVKKEVPGAAAASIVPGILESAMRALPFKKSMRWGDEDATFARPVQWIVALFGGEVIPVRFADVQSARLTRGHRFLSSGAIELDGTEAQYGSALREAGVIADPAERLENVRAEVARAASEAGGEPLPDDALLDTVTYLVETPSAVLGSFDAGFLDLPEEVLVSEMRGHQKYFSVRGKNGKLLPNFVAVSNTPVRDPAVSRAGYERVLRARLSDARFFFDEDRKRTLESRVEALARVTWQRELGSTRQKVERIRALARWLAGAVGKGDVALLDRAALLCKADLTTGMVGEFPDLQGVMGREYARADGEPPEVAQAIEEHYLPRVSEGPLPKSDEGAILALADRLDTLVGIFAIGKEPTSATDPFGLRRACLGVIRIMLDRSYRVSLKSALEQAAGGYAATTVTDATIARVLEFFQGRLESYWSASGDLVPAVLNAENRFYDLVATSLRLKALSTLRGRPELIPTAEVFKRATNIVAKSGAGAAALREDLFDAHEERDLARAVKEAQPRVEAAVARDDYAAALEAIGRLQPVLHTFYEKVFVNVDDVAVRDNRLALLKTVRDLGMRVADLSRIQIGQ